MMRIAILTLGCLLCMQGISLAGTVYYNSVNDHYYELVNHGSDLNWTSANANANAMSHLSRPGHLVTLTSAAEQNFIDTYIRPDMGDHAWIGLFQPPGTSEPYGGWQWVTGEPVSYTHWNAGEPNNAPSYGDEDWTMLYSSTGLWNDYWNKSDIPLYIVEYDAPPAPAVPVPLAGVMGVALLAGLIRRRSR